jgi:dihydrofolate reductase
MSSTPVADPGPPQHPQPRVTLVVAVAANGVIGDQGRLPWHLPEDLKRFRQLTMGHTIVMGRKTWESIGRLLPGRRTVIVTRQPDYRVEGATVVHGLDDALATARGEEEVFVIGGNEIFAAAFPRADRLQVTEIDADFPGDTTFPDYDRGEWREVSRESHRTADGLAFHFVVYERSR